MKRPLIILTGPTAVGKTALSIQLAKAIGGEIISADSMQVYQYMDIGSAKIRRDEMDGVPHYLVDVLKPEEEFHVVRFQEMAKEAMEKIYANNHIPVVVGGTGFYIQALCMILILQKATAMLPIAANWNAMLMNTVSTHCTKKLRAIDPESADSIHANNVKRVIRALEYYHLTGEKISVHNAREREKESPYDYRYFVLNDKRDHLYRRIDLRVDQMMEEGLLQEVKRLKEMGYHRGMVSMQGLGYKEILSYLDGEISLDEAVYEIKRDTRHFAKRQITWFKRERDVIWVNKDEYGYDEKKILNSMMAELADDPAFGKIRG